MPPKIRTATAKSPAWQVRAPFPNEVEQVLQILCAAFRLRVDAARPIFINDPFYDLSHKRVLTSQAHGLVACLTVVPARVQIGAASIPFGGIAGVATLPAHQRQGYAGELLQGVLRALADELQYPVSGLFTDLPDYYRRFGWEYATRSCAVTIAPGDLPRYEGADSVRIVSAYDLLAQQQIESLHASALPSRPSGAFERDERRWNVIRRFLPGCKSALHQRDGDGSGYLIFDESEDLLRVHELYGQSPAAERALIGFLARRECARIEWSAPLSEIQHLALHEFAGASKPSSITVQSDMMVRVADVPAALCAVHTANFAPTLNRIGKSLTVIVENDVVVPKNGDPLRLTPKGVESGAREDADTITIDIEAFGQLFLGYYDASTMHALGKLKASHAVALETADLLFPARDPFVAMPNRF